MSAECAHYALEIGQSSFAEPARVVANVGEDKVLGIETGAARDGGTMVMFIACPFTAGYPEKREWQPTGARSRSKMSIASWSRTSARRSVEYIRVPYREYLGTDHDRAGLWSRSSSSCAVCRWSATSLTGTVMVRNFSKNYDLPQFRACCRDDHA